jgi:hypothetical protein
MRLGRSDLEAGMRAVREGARPAAVITGLGEGLSTTSRARRLSATAGIPWMADPLLFRTALEGYRTPSALQDLDYTPGRDGEPYLPEDLASREVTNIVGRSVVGAQVDLQAGAVIGGGFTVSSIDDPWLKVNQHLLRVQADAAATWDLPLIAALPLRISGFTDLDSQRLLIRALMARRPDAWLLMADGLSEDSGIERTIAGLRLALALQAASAPVILARAGGLRRVALSLGVAGVEFGLGRMLRFSVPDFSKSGRGPGPIPGPHVELGSIGVSVPFVHADRFVREGLLAESNCGCSSCTQAASFDERMARMPEHNAHVVTTEIAALSTTVRTDRVAELDRLLQTAVDRSRWLDRDQPRAIVRPRAEHQRRVLESAVNVGLLDPQRIVAELELDGLS